MHWDYFRDELESLNILLLDSLINVNKCAGLLFDYTLGAVNQSTRGFWPICTNSSCVYCTEKVNFVEVHTVHLPVSRQKYET